MKHTRDSQIQDDGDLKKYRTETPNLIYELRLTPFEIALYSHFKRVAGAGPDGRCYRSTERLAEETGMSEGMISKAKKGLLRTDRPGLNGKALIKVDKDDKRPGRPRDVVTIVDVWPENFLFFAKQSSPQSSPGELQSSPQSSPGEAKNNTESLKKEIDEESTEETLNVGDELDESADAAPPSEPVQATGPTPNASQSDFANLLSEDEDAGTGSAAIAGHKGAAEKSLKGSSGLKGIEIDRVVRLTGDEASRRRFEQLYDLAEGAGLLTLWDQARKSTHKATQAQSLTGPPGAYFNATVAKLLNEQQPGLVPVGTREERRQVRGLARSSLASAGARSAGARSAGARSAGARSAGARSAGARSAGAQTGNSQPDG